MNFPYSIYLGFLIHEVLKVYIVVYAKKQLSEPNNKHHYMRWQGCRWTQHDWDWLITSQKKVEKFRHILPYWDRNFPVLARINSFI